MPDSFVFHYLQDYTLFLLEQRLDALARQNVKLFKEVNMPMLQLFAHLSEEEFEEVIRDSLQKFLQQVLDNTALQEAIAAIEKWRADELPGIAKHQVQIADIVQTYSVRKQLLNHFLLDFTNNPQLILHIINELERFHAKLEQYAFQVYTDIQKEEALKATLQLQEYQEELETSNEELRESHEELSTLNEELKAYVVQLSSLKTEAERSRNFYLTILEDFPALIWRADLTGQCDYFNKTWLQFTGRSLAQELGNGWVENVHPDDVQFCMDHYLYHFKKQERFNMEYRLRRFDGQYRWIHDIGSPLFDIDQNFIGFLGACFDIHDAKMNELALTSANQMLSNSNFDLVKAEEQLKEINIELERRVQQRTLQLRENNEQLKRINADLDNFIYIASHDLKAPISNLEGLMLILKRKVQNKLVGKEEQIFEMVNTSLSKLQRTIKDLTEITRIQKEMNAPKELVDLEEVLEEVKEELALMIAQGNVEIIQELEIKSFYYSRLNLKHILHNLLSNAIKFRSNVRLAVIHVRTCLEGEGISLSIKDNGLGIEGWQMKRLFTMFSRFHTHVEGTGIGLYIVKRLVENDNGEITVESKPGVGTTFNIILPQVTERLPVTAGLAS